MERVLLVEDDDSLAAAVVRELSASGLQVVRAVSGEEALRLAGREPPDLVLLDWGLPGIDGLEVLRRLRRASSVPVLMLTARDEEADRVLGLEVGADDYLVKPFAPRELVARARALLRRAAWLRDALTRDRDGTGAPVDLGRLKLHPDEHRATLDGEPVDLTRLETGLLTVLARHPGRVFSRAYLLETLWSDAADSGERAVDNAVSRLRKKLGPYGERIEAVWGAGYRLRKEP
ncbi:MAG: DNA-binding response regulator [Acidobacteria bacterium]|nr:MAG: DNA-binding response regulator [Acidobacteriota bacterium]